MRPGALRLNINVIGVENLGRRVSNPLAQGARQVGLIVVTGFVDGIEDRDALLEQCRGLLGARHLLNLFG